MRPNWDLARFTIHLMYLYKFREPAFTCAAEVGEIGRMLRLQGMHVDRINGCDEHIEGWAGLLVDSSAHATVVGKDQRKGLKAWIQTPTCCMINQMGA